MSPRIAVLDANEAVASVAHRASEVVAIYPITPASAMGEHADAWSAEGRKNLFGDVPRVIEMQSEAGAAGVVHGALLAGSLATTFTASQGLLLMIPELYKIAGELTPFCLHVAARALATHALSIFGDHSDVMACRQIGLAMLCSNSAQEAQDLAAIGHAATLRMRVPVLHFFDGFRTSHEMSRVELLEDDDLRALLDEEAIAAHRARGLSPDHPRVRGTAQNPDAFFQGREAVNPFYDLAPRIVQETMDDFARRTGRAYRLFEYVGAEDAERVVVIMGSGGEAVHETVEWMNARGERVGVVKVRLYRPFDVRAFVDALPTSVRSIAVMDRTKEPGAVGDPLLLDVVAALEEARASGLTTLTPNVIGGRYGLSSKEFTPAMVQAIYAELARATPRRRFTVGIEDDVTHRSLGYDKHFDLESNDVVRAVFFGLGSDGSVGAAKASLEIVGLAGQEHVQGYFAYDSRKSGTLTTSEMRFSKRPIRSSYRVRRAQFVGVHHPRFLERYEVLEIADVGAMVLLNVPWAPERVWDSLPREVQERVLEKRLRLFAIDGAKVARDAGLGGHLGLVMQTCAFALAGVLPRDEALAELRASIPETYEKHGPEVIAANLAAIDRALAAMHEVPIAGVTATHDRPPPVPREAPPFVQRVTAALVAGHGDALPVSAFPVDGGWPTGTSKYEKRAIAAELPAADLDLCIQCNKCALFCPHAAIRVDVVQPNALEGAPEGMPVTNYRGKEFAGQKYVLQVAPDDCTGCGLCAAICPAKDKHEPTRKALMMQPADERREAERARWDFFTHLPPPPRDKVRLDVKGAQFFEPLFEFSGACAACGETPYLGLLTRLFGDRALIANATGCSSIFGGNLPTTPWTTNAEGRGPAWANSLFEDDAEVGLGFRAAIDARRTRARALVTELAPIIGDELAKALLDAPQDDEAQLAAQRDRVAALRRRLADLDTPNVRVLSQLADDLVRRSVWIVGGDGWAYDIGYGGLDHVLASGADVNVLVLDSEVYSNTGGQQSKATPLGAAAKFAAAGKATGKKDLGLMAMTYGHVYVAQVSLGANDAHVVKAFREAESFRGPSLIIGHAPCIEHGYSLEREAEHEKLAVSAGLFPLYRHDPRRAAQGEAPLVLDDFGDHGDLAAVMASERRFRAVERKDPARYAQLLTAAREEIERKRALYRHLAKLAPPPRS